MLQDLIREMSSANPRWGSPRIVGELAKLGIDVALGQTPSPRETPGSVGRPARHPLTPGAPSSPRLRMAANGNRMWHPQLR
jgi:hypothetical protein